MFLHLPYEGQSFLEGDADEENLKKQESVKFRVLSVAHYILCERWKVMDIKAYWSWVHPPSGNWAKQLILLFHESGHCMYYEGILKVDKALVEKTVLTMDDENGCCCSS